MTNPDQSPAENVDVEVQPGTVKGRTKKNGMAKVIVNTQADFKTLDVTVSHIRFEDLLISTNVKIS